jgi:hypothetical protein
MMRTLVTAVWCATLSWAVGCSSETEGTTTSTAATGTTASGGGTFSCDDQCNAAQKLACGKDDLATCLSDCTQARTKLMTCAAEYELAVSCAVPHLKCSSDGEAQLDNGKFVENCTGEVVALEACAACLVDVASSECSKCEATSCCTERQAAYADASIIDYVRCQNACADAACHDACDAKYPSTAQKNKVARDCGESKCAKECTL